MQTGKRRPCSSLTTNIISLPRFAPGGTQTARLLPVQTACLAPGPWTETRARGPTLTAPIMPKVLSSSLLKARKMISFLWQTAGTKLICNIQLMYGCRCILKKVHPSLHGRMSGNRNELSWSPGAISSRLSRIEIMHRVTLPKFLGICIHDGQPSGESCSRINIPDILSVHRGLRMEIQGGRVPQKDFFKTF